MFVSAFISGLFATRIRLGALYGSLTIFLTYLILLVFIFLTSPALDILNIFIGIVGLSGMGWLVAIIILILGLLIGATGGYLGGTVSQFVPWSMIQG